MYLRETRRKNKDGSVVSYLQLAHNERHPETGSPVAKIIHNFGRADQLDREALRRLVGSISRVLDPAEAMLPGSGLAEVEILDARRCGGAYVLDALFARLGIGKALRQAAAGRRLDADLVERICFALVAQRALEPGSKLAATRWVAERVAIEGCPGFDSDAAYAAMDFLAGALPEITEGVFTTTANLLNLACDVIFVDTSSTYFEIDLADEEAELAGLADEAEAKAAAAAGEAQGGPSEAAMRRFNKHSKDKRADLPQVAITKAGDAHLRRVLTRGRLGLPSPARGARRAGRPPGGAAARAARLLVAGTGAPARGLPQAGRAARTRRRWPSRASSAASCGGR